jgi:hypothetical protein
VVDAVEEEDEEEEMKAIKLLAILQWEQSTQTQTYIIKETTNNRSNTVVVMK